LAEKLYWKGLKINKSVGNRKIIMLDEVRHRIGKGYALKTKHLRNTTLLKLQKIFAKIMKFEALPIHFNYMSKLSP
jgi:hypothetical protein